MKKIVIVAALTIILALPANLTNAATFSDVSAAHDYEEAIQYLYDEGIVGGYPDGSFKPDNTINRAEFTKIVLGAVETVDTSDKSLGNLPLTDLEDGAWYIPYIRGAVAPALYGKSLSISIEGRCNKQKYN